MFSLGNTQILRFHFQLTNYQVEILPTYKVSILLFINGENKNV